MPGVLTQNSVLDSVGTMLNPSPGDKSDGRGTHRRSHKLRDSLFRSTPPISPSLAIPVVQLSDRKDQRPWQIEFFLHLFDRQALLAHLPNLLANELSNATSTLLPIFPVGLLGFTSTTPMRQTQLPVPVFVCLHRQGCRPHSLFGLLPTAASDTHVLVAMRVRGLVPDDGQPAESFPDLNLRLFHGTHHFSRNPRLDEI